MGSDGQVPPPLRFDHLRRPLRHLREQARSVTGWFNLHDTLQDQTTTRAFLPSTADGIRVSYLSSGAETTRRVIFIHGSPGHASEWRPYLNTCPHDQHRVAIDRPGFGHSLPRRPLPGIAHQADAIAPLLAPNCILVGYSFGGLVAMQLAFDHPDLVAGLVLIGCPIDPELEHVHPLQRLAANAIVSKLLPQNLNASNFELIGLRPALAGIAERLGTLRARVTILQGLRDTLVPASNAHVLADRLTGIAQPRLVLFPDGDHYLPWTHRDSVSQAIAYTIRDCDLL